MKLKLFAASPRVLRIAALKHHLALGCEVQPIDLGRGDQPISQYGTLSQRLALAHPARSAYARFLVLSERTGLIGKVANGSRAVNRRANGGCLRRADRAPAGVASWRTRLPAIAAIPLRVWSRLHVSNFPKRECKAALDAKATSIFRIRRCAYRSRSASVRASMRKSAAAALARRAASSATSSSRAVPRPMRARIRPRSRIRSE